MKSYSKSSSGIYGCSRFARTVFSLPVSHNCWWDSAKILWHGFIILRYVNSHSFETSWPLILAVSKYNICPFEKWIRCYNNTSKILETSFSSWTNTLTNTVPRVINLLTFKTEVVNELLTHVLYLKLCIFRYVYRPISATNI